MMKHRFVLVGCYVTKTLLKSWKIPSFTGGGRPEVLVPCSISGTIGSNDREELDIPKHLSYH
jgi:hypothetical protein